ncbi:hypothetical protein GWI33_009897 [Rhynchophorus ferrugineus]|uniref:Uncharacterized protein n=1 Tax=Rhynchophorus ferrugineus TaxID=354439 RepID=A0A834I908_RHYFE|nr:hypothetical protein GWI33_009897 [Rhynchophorus ferrugineus]
MSSSHWICVDGCRKTETRRMNEPNAMKNLHLISRAYFQFVPALIRFIFQNLDDYLKSIVIWHGVSRDQTKTKPKTEWVFIPEPGKSGQWRAAVVVPLRRSWEFMNRRPGFRPIEQIII